MIISTVIAATIVASQPIPTPTVDHSKMDHSATGAKEGTSQAKMDCCKDGCACCAKDRAKSAT